MHEMSECGYSVFLRNLDSDLYFASHLSLKIVKLNLSFKHPITFRFTVKMENSAYFWSFSLYLDENQNNRV